MTKQEFKEHAKELAAIRVKTKYYPTEEELKELLCHDLSPYKDYILWLAIRNKKRLNEDQRKVKKKLIELAKFLFDVNEDEESDEKSTDNAAKTQTAETADESADAN